MEILEIKKLEKNFTKFYCELCDFKCRQKCDWTRHLSTAKHAINVDGNQRKSKKLEKNFKCICGQQYKTNSGLWKHHKTCTKICEPEPEPEIEQDEHNLLGLTDKEIISALIRQTDKLTKLIENGTGVGTITNNNNTTNTTNIDNKSFNLNFFLNETCKDALNIDDFVRTIKMDLNDLEHTGRVGYIDGITNIFVRNLNNLERHMRPLHCSDLKREVLYIKDNDRWEKEIDQKPILTKAIKNIANQNIRQIQLWKDKFPGCTDVDSKMNTVYLKIVSNAMAGMSKDECERNYNKIMKNIARETTIDR